MPRDGHPALEVRVPLQEEPVQAVHLRGHRVHDGLAVGGAVVEEHVQDGVVDEVTQAVDAGQRDPLQVTAGQRAGGAAAGADADPNTVPQQIITSERTDTVPKGVYCNPALPRLKAQHGLCSHIPRIKSLSSLPQEPGLLSALAGALQSRAALQELVNQFSGAFSKVRMPTSLPRSARERQKPLFSGC